MADALSRAAESEGARFPERFAVVEVPGNRNYRMITDTTTGKTTEVNLTCFGSVRRVLAELFPDD